MSDQSSNPYTPENIEKLIQQWKAGDEKAIDALLTLWNTASVNAEVWKGYENTLRLLIFDTAWPKPERGRNLARLPHGMALVGNYKINYRIDPAGLSAAREFIPLELFQSVIEYKPSVKPTPYRELTPDQHRLFADFITEKPGMPDLEVKPANKIRWPK